MNDPVWDQLNRRIDEQHRHLCERLDDVQRHLRELHALCRAAHQALTARLEAHETYHRAGEHRWGFARLAQRYPFRLAAAAALLAAAALGSPDALLRLLRLAARWFANL